MAEPFVGEIKLVGFTFAPIGWAFCDGQTMSISDNDELFTLIGTTYGGDGQQTFNLPNLNGRAIIHRGQGPGLSAYSEGDFGGVENVTLSAAQIPAHVHPVRSSTQIGTEGSPVNHFLSDSSLALGNTYDTNPSGIMPPATIRPSGLGQPHQNMQPFLAMNYVIALVGIFPPRP